MCVHTHTCVQVTSEHAAALHDDADRIALEASQHRRHAAADAVAEQAASLVKQAPSVLGPVAEHVVSREEKAGKRLAHHAARLAVEQAITRAAASRMAELPYEEQDPGAVCGGTDCPNKGTDDVRAAAASALAMPEIVLLQQGAEADVNDDDDSAAADTTDASGGSGASDTSIHDLVAQLREQRSKLKGEVAGSPELSAPLSASSSASEKEEDKEEEDASLEAEAEAEAGVPKEDSAAIADAQAEMRDEDADGGLIRGTDAAVDDAAEASVDEDDVVGEAAAVRDASVGSEQEHDSLATLEAPLTHPLTPPLTRLRPWGYP